MANTYCILRYTTGNYKSKWSDIVNFVVKPARTSVFYVKVRALNQGGYSPYSSVVMFEYKTEVQYVYIRVRGINSAGNGIWSEKILLIVTIFDETKNYYGKKTPYGTGQYKGRESINIVTIPNRYSYTLPDSNNKISYVNTQKYLKDIPIGKNNSLTESTSDNFRW